MYLDNEFPYTTQTMSTPLKTRTGKPRLDRYGQPLTSIRVKQSPNDKARMIQRMVAVASLFHTDPDLFPADDREYGVDPVAMSSQRVFEDLLEQVGAWQAKPNNDIFESFIVRHNAMVEHLKAIAQVNDPTGSDSAWIETKYAIRRVRKRNANMQRVVNTTLNTTFDKFFTKLDK